MMAAESPFLKSPVVLAALTPSANCVIDKFRQECSRLGGIPKHFRCVPFGKQPALCVARALAGALNIRNPANRLTTPRDRVATSMNPRVVLVLAAAELRDDRELAAVCRQVRLEFRGNPGTHYWFCRFLDSGNTLPVIGRNW